jgi:hypothetical protein
MVPPQRQAPPFDRRAFGPRPMQLRRIAAAATRRGTARYGSSHGLNGKGASKSTTQSASAAREGIGTRKVPRHCQAYPNSAATQIVSIASSHARVAADPNSPPDRFTIALCRVTSGGPPSLLARFACTSGSLMVRNCSLQPEYSLNAPSVPNKPNGSPNQRMKTIIPAAPMARLGPLTNRESSSSPL